MIACATGAHLALELYSTEFCKDADSDLMLEGVTAATPVTKAVANHPDVILLDLRMLVVSGTEALNELRANSPLAACPSSHSPPLADGRVDASEAGSDKCRRKACLPDALVGHIARMLGGRSSP